MSLNECNSQFIVNDDDDNLKKWVYPMFFSTIGGSYRIKIVESLQRQPEKIVDIASKTNISYHNVKYHIDILEQGDFLNKNNKMYFISLQFKRNFHILNDIIKQKVTI